jgi:hypothetical protein
MLLDITTRADLAPSNGSGRFRQALCDVPRSVVAMGELFVFDVDHPWSDAIITQISAGYMASNRPLVVISCAF